MDSAAPMTDLSAVKLALMAKAARTQAAGLLRADPIAIVGMACRIPGGGTSPEAFWDLLCTGGDAVREVPADRWDADAWFDADPAEPRKATTRSGAFLDRIDAFDAAYFGILPREAERMDPQQRLLLEVAIEALADAGLPDARLAGARAGVFIASYHNDYAQLQYEDPDAIDARTLTGTLHSVLANRLSYLLDLRGPSVSIDTACSSSLVAIHLACQSLRFGETDVAIAGGVSLMVAPELFVSMSKIGFMSPDGRCKTFDARADGFGRGEGCGVVALKRLADALADGDRVLALVRGSAVNQDGHSTVLAAPNGLAQRAMIEEALANAQLSPGRIGFVETHGTGTALGDPIEVEALAATVGRRDASTGACYLGAAKASIGHLEAAAGVAGVIKAVLALRHHAIPPQANFHELSPHISLAGTRLAIPTSLVTWPPGSSARCAGISSFGVGGTNAHVIVEEAPTLPDEEAATAGDGVKLLALSARSPAALRELAGEWHRFLATSRESIADISFTAAERRSHHDWRVGIVGRSKDDFRARLDEFVRDTHGADVATGHRAVAPPKIAFVFSGQGPQWYAMGRELLAEEPVFAAVMSECDALLRPLSGSSLLEALAAPEDGSRLEETEVAQPAIFAIQVALVALWKSWGISPEGVVGHSVGEIAALHAAGVLSLAEAVRVVWNRGHIMQRATGLGRMASVSLTPVEAEKIVAIYGERLSIGAINGPASVVISGDAAALAEVLAVLGLRGVHHKMLPVQYAFHSAQMAPFQQQLATELAGLTTSTATTAIYSTVTGELARDASFDAAYFGRNVREPVRFASAIAAMSRDGFDVFVEIGPHPVLAVSIAESVPERAEGVRVLASLRRSAPERAAMLRGLAALYAAGCDPVWSAVERAAGQVVSLPAYPWQRERFWIRPRPAGVASPNAASSGHPLLGTRVATAGDRVMIFEGGTAGTDGWLADHRIFGHLPLPAAAVMELFAAAAARALGDQTVVSDFVMHRPCMLGESAAEPARWQMTVVRASPDKAALELYEAPRSGGWRLIASAVAATGREDARQGLVQPGENMQPVDADAFYARLAELGVAFGPAFRSLREIRRGEGTAEAIIRVDDARAGQGDRYAVHPVLLDGALQLCVIAGARPDALPDAVFLPLGAGRFVIEAAGGTEVRARVRVTPTSSSGTLAADITVESLDGSAVARISEMHFARAEPGVFDAEGDTEGTLYEVQWRNVAAPPSVERADKGSMAGSWLLFGDHTGVVDAVAAGIAMRGGRTICVRAGQSLEEHARESWTIDPANPGHFADVLKYSLQGEPLRGVVHLWNLDVPEINSSDAGAIEAANLLGVGSLLHLAQALGRATPPASVPLWVVTCGAEDAGDGTTVSRPLAAGARGLAGVIALEHPELSCRVVDIDASDGAVAALMHELLNPSDADRVALRAGVRRVPALVRRSVAKPPGLDGRAISWRVVRPGTLDGLEVGGSIMPRLGADEVRLRVTAAGLNFRDVLLALGMYPGTGIALGAECAGVVVERGTDVRDFSVGDAVFGFAPGSMANEVVVPAAFVTRIPAGVSAEAAAGLPVAMLTAWYGLHRLAGLKRGERVLIHAATGGVGMAAVQLAQRTGAIVFATAGSPEKRALLRTRGVEHVFDSRSVAFSREILASTGGAGVDVVLNSLSGDFIRASLDTLARGGRFLEIGKRGVWSPTEMASARADVAYHLYDLGADAVADRALLRPMLDGLCAALIDGSLLPLPVRIFDFDRAQDAFRFMAQARHVGKIVLRLPVSPGDDSPPLVRSNATYLVTGGLGALGIHTARWLAKSGASHVVLVGRHAPIETAASAIRELEATGVCVRAFAADVADRDRMQEVLAEVRAALPPLRGVVHAAGVLDDGVVLQQDWTRSANVLRGKAEGAFVLHSLTADDTLDFFVLYSAAGVLLGARGQGAYAAANAELDALAYARRGMGLPALSVAWGAWSGAGMNAATSHRGASWMSRGLRPIDVARGFAELERLLRSGAVNAAVLPIDWTRFLASLPDGAHASFFREVSPRTTTAPTAPRENEAGAFRAQLLQQPAAQRKHALMRYLHDRAVHVVGLAPDARIEGRTPLKEIGLDSLMAVELRNSIARSVGHPLPATLLFDFPTLEALANHISGVLGLEQTPAGTGRKATVAAAVVAQLTDDEAEAALLAELERSAPGAHR